MDEKTAAETYLKNLGCCHVTSCNACFFGTCASCCVTGLMIQKANKNNVDDGYCQACYPCVITQDCCTYSACFVVLSLLPCLACLNIFQACTNWTVRRTLMENAKVDRPTPFTTTLHVLCPLCFCTPCNDAEYVIKIKNAGTANTAVNGLVF